MVQPISDPSDTEGITRRIADLNDWLRHHITSPGQNRVMMTRGIANLIGDVSIFRNFRKRAELMRVIRDFENAEEATSFSARERDMGWFQFESERCMWKIDYYATDMLHGSEDPADPDRTVRVLTIMLLSEY